AQNSYEALLKAAIGTGNQRDVAEQHYSLSGVRLQQEQFVVALGHCDESLARFKALESPYDVEYALLRRADILWRLGRVDEAERQLAEMVHRGIDAGGAAALERSRRLRTAMVALARDEPRRAAADIRLVLAGRKDEIPRGQHVELERVLALALARQGQLAEALAHIDAAGRSAAELSETILQSDIALTRSEVLVRLKRFEEALPAAGTLAEQLAAQQRHESAWIASRLAVAAARRLGRAADAAKWQAFAGAERTLMVAQFDEPDLQQYERRRDLNLMF
ncbi:MAG: hypothetical protein ACRD15_13720, partial [Vicinamibacterales bacterium]